LEELQAELEGSPLWPKILRYVSAEMHGDKILQDGTNSSEKENEYRERAVSDAGFSLFSGTPWTYAEDDPAPSRLSYEPPDQAPGSGWSGHWWS
jgi:hypothetical protein